MPFQYVSVRMMATPQAEIGVLNVYCITTIQYIFKDKYFDRFLYYNFITIKINLFYLNILLLYYITYVFYFGDDDDRLSTIIIMMTSRRLLLLLFEEHTLLFIA